jgi:ferredoxin
MEPDVPPWSDNVPGRFCVTEDCIICAVCTDVAPMNFAFSVDEDHAVVVVQPENADQVAAALDALEGCPVEAIWDREGVG